MVNDEKSYLATLFEWTRVVWFVVDMFAAQEKSPDLVTQLARKWQVGARRQRDRSAAAGDAHVA